MKPTDLQDLERVKDDLTDLLPRLRAAIHPDLGKTRAGASAAAHERSVIDAGAFTLYEAVTEQLASMFTTATDQPPSADPAVNLKGWFAEFDMAHRRHEIEDVQLARQTGVLASMVRRIRTYFEPPRTLELLAPCPTCGESWARDKKMGDRIVALAVTYGTDHPPQAFCRFCGHHWDDREQFIELAESIGATVDWETVHALTA